MVENKVSGYYRFYASCRRLEDAKPKINYPKKHEAAVPRLFLDNTTSTTLFRWIDCYRRVDESSTEPEDELES